MCLREKGGTMQTPKINVNSLVEQMLQKAGEKSSFTTPSSSSILEFFIQHYAADLKAFAQDSKELGKGIVLLALDSVRWNMIQYLASSSSSSASTQHQKKPKFE